MSTENCDYNWLVEVRKPDVSCYFGRVLSPGRRWHTIAGPYTIGDVHIEPEDPENALFADLVVNVYGDGRSQTVVARTCEGDVPAGDIGAMLLDNSFVVPAIGRVLGILSGRY